jgi:hypothetical protein
MWKRRAQCRYIDSVPVLSLTCSPLRSTRSLVLLLKVHHGGGVARLFLREGLNIMLKLFDRDFRVGSRLLLRLDGFVRVVQLRIVPCQRRSLFLQSAIYLGVLRLSSSFRSVVCGVRAVSSHVKS